MKKIKGVWLLVKLVLALCVLAVIDKNVFEDFEDQYEN